MGISARGFVRGHHNLSGPFRRPVTKRRAMKGLRDEALAQVVRELARFTAAMATSFDSKDLMIHWDAQASAITLQWKRAAQDADFKQGLAAAVTEVEKAQASRMVADHSVLNLQCEDESYFLKSWVPSAARAGVKRLAVVVPRRQYVQIPKTRIQQRLKSGALEFCYFAAMDEARIWVQEAAAA